jgi:NADH-quinone oxidoreductase subunit G
MATALKSAAKATVLFGTYAESLPNAATLRALAQAVATMSGAAFGSLTAGANSAGGHLAGAVPHRAAAGKGASFGLNAQAMFAEKLAGYLLLGVEPEHDVANPAAAIAALNGADFVVALSPYKSDAMLSYADVILPVAPFTETSGTYVNIEGRWQSFEGSVKPLGETRPAWKVLRVLGNLFAVNGFEYLSSEEVCDELKAITAGLTLEHGAWSCPAKLSDVGNSLVRVADTAPYTTDATVRRAPALQATVHGNAATARINGAVASALGLGDAVNVEVSQGDARCVLPLTIDNRVADGAVWLSAGLPGVAGFGSNGAAIALKPV